MDNDLVIVLGALLCCLFTSFGFFMFLTFRPLYSAFEILELFEIDEALCGKFSWSLQATVNLFCLNIWGVLAGISASL